MARRANLSVIMRAATALADLDAQNGPALNVLYSCNSARSKVKITRCTTGAGVSCDVQFFDSSSSYLTQAAKDRYAKQIKAAEQNRPKQ